MNDSNAFFPDARSESRKRSRSGPTNDPHNEQPSNGSSEHRDTTDAFQKIMALLGNNTVKESSNSNTALPAYAATMHSSTPSIIPIGTGGSHGGIIVPEVVAAVADGGVSIEAMSLAPQLPLQEGIETPVINAKKRKKMERITEVMLKNTGDVMHTIYSELIEAIDSDVKWDQEPKLLCSYNWQESDDGKNVIFVPGGPPKWTPRSLPFTIAPDSGFHYMDHNHARQPRFPYASMFQALAIMNPTFRFNHVDIIADRNNLRTLLEFIQGKSVGPFRLDLILIDETLVLVRKEDRFWKRADGLSYGYNFETQFTRAGPGLENATSHYRAIEFPMGPLNLVVRYEADAYYEEPETGDLAPAEVEIVNGGPEDKPRFNFSAPIQVYKRGDVIPCSKMAELKSQSIKYEADGTVRSDGIYPCMDQLWFGRTSHLFTGKYESGTGEFKRVKYYDAKRHIATWEEKNQEMLRKLVKLLADLKAMMTAENGPIRTAVLVREEKNGPIRIRAMKDKLLALQQNSIQKHWEQKQRGYPAHRRGGPSQRSASHQRGGSHHHGGPRQHDGGSQHYGEAHQQGGGYQHGGGHRRGGSYQQGAHHTQNGRSHRGFHNDQAYGGGRGRERERGHGGITGYTPAAGRGRGSNQNTADSTDQVREPPSYSGGYRGSGRRRY